MKKLVLILIIVAVIAGGAWYIIDSRRETSSQKVSTTNNETNKIASVPTGYVRYSNDELHISFAHPQEWQVEEVQNVQASDFKVLTVGPLQVRAEKKDAETFGGDDPLLLISQGFYEQSGRYYANGGSSDSPYKLDEDTKELRKIITKNGHTALLMVKASALNGEDMVLAAINLDPSNHNQYAGVGIRYTLENGFTTEQAVAQLETILKSFSDKQ